MSETRLTFRKRVAWKLALACWAVRLDRLGNWFEDVRWTR